MWRNRDGQRDAGNEQKANQFDPERARARQPP